MSAAIISGAGRLALSSRASSFSQKMSRLALAGRQLYGGRHRDFECV